MDEMMKDRMDALGEATDAAVPEATAAAAEAVPNAAAAGPIVAAAVPDGDDDEDGGLYIKFRKPYEFERRVYDGIDLSGLEDLTGNDMIAVNRIMSRQSAGVEIMPEVSMEYACHLAARASKQPVEFFLGMSPRELMRVKNRVMGFLFGAD